MKQGFFIIGKCLGTRQLSFVDKATGEVKYKNEIGIGIVKDDGFGGSTQDKVIISVRKPELFTNDLITTCKNLIGRPVRVGIFPSAWGFDGKTGISYIFNEQSTIEEVK